MRTVAIVSEFNPFHQGHAYLVRSLRDMLGENTCIISLMSGNYTQRGDVAIADKFTRAALAIEGGLDLVLEIPFPYTVSSAEYYATAGVQMAAALGVVDTLAFGSECGDITVLSRVAERITSARFRDAFSAAVRSEASHGHARLTEEVYAALYGAEEAAILSEPNNILAIEYLKANAALPLPLSVMTVKRLGGYHDQSKKDGISATAVRHAIATAPATIRDMMPSASAAILEVAMAEGRAPADILRLGTVLLAYFRMQTTDPTDSLGYRLRDSATKATDFTEFTLLAATKRYTHSHIRRALWHRLFGITSTDLRKPPAYTQVLGMNERGRCALRKAKKIATLALLTKPADAAALTGEAARQAHLSQKADLLYPLALPRPVAGNADLLASPYRKE